MKDTGATTNKSEHASTQIETTRQQPLLDSYTVLLIVGFATFWATTDSCFYSISLINPSLLYMQQVPWVQMIGLLGSALTSVFVVVKKPSLSVQIERKAMIRLSLVSGISILIVSVFQQILPLSLCLILLFIVGISAGFTMFIWVWLCAKNDSRCGTGVMVAGSIAVCGLFELVVFALGLQLGSYATAFLPLVGLLFFMLYTNRNSGSNKENQEKSENTMTYDESDKGIKKLGLTWRFILGLIVFSIAAGMMQFFYVPSNPNVIVVSAQMRLFSRYAVACLFFVGSVIFAWKPHIMYRIGALVVIAAFLILPFLPEQVGFVGSIATNAGYTCMELMIWTVLFESAKAQRQNPLYTVGTGRLVMAAAAFVGVMLNSIFSIWAINSQVTQALASLMTYALVIVTTLVLDESRISGSWHLIERSFQQNVNFDLFTKTCRSLAESHNLTPREYDVLVLLASGRSAPYIANELCIATSTVNFHVRHIYEKMGIKSKQALIDVVNTMESD